MEYLADTVAIIRFVSKSGSIGARALTILKDADSASTAIIISVMSLVEVLYLSEKSRVKLKLSDLMNRIKNHNNYRIIDLDTNILQTAEKISSKNLELHDRLIVATAVYLKVPILTSDKIIRESKLTETIWE